MQVMIDPGHGGYDPGACGNGLQEKDITLDICLRLKPLLEHNGIEVCLTRDGDYAPWHLEGQLNAELNARSAISNDFGADLFVSVHINSGGGTGEEVLISAAGSRAEQAANKVYDQINEVTGWANRGVKVAYESVLGYKTNAPAILTENGFIDSEADTAKLKDSNFRQALAIAHAKGICGYFGITYKEEGGNEVLKHAVIYFTAKDFSSALMVADKLGGCATFCRNGVATIHEEAKSAEHLVVVGGPECTDRSNVNNCCGLGAPETAIKAAQYVQTL